MLRGKRRRNADINQVLLTSKSKPRSRRQAELAKPKRHCVVRPHHRWRISAVSWQTSVCIHSRWQVHRQLDRGTVVYRQDHALQRTLRRTRESSSQEGIYHDVSLA